MKYFDMFSGIGGFSYAIEKELDAECVGYSEINPFAIKIYENHYPDRNNFGDAEKMDTSAIPDFDLLVAGFPCQSFSIAGGRCGFLDRRGTLFYQIERILEDKAPRHLLLENVRGLVSNQKGKTFQEILGVLSDMGYVLEWHVLNSKNFGVPQDRKRTYIIGHLGTECGLPIFPLPDCGKTINGELGSDISYTIDANYFKGPNKDNRVRRQLVEVNGRHRRLTPLEIERLQGYPDNYTQGISDKQRYICLGNSVTTNVVRAVIKEMVKKGCLK